MYYKDVLGISAEVIRMLEVLCEKAPSALAGDPISVHQALALEYTSLWTSDQLACIGRDNKVALATIVGWMAAKRS